MALNSELKMLVKASLALMASTSSLFSADWDGLAVPADPGRGMEWKLQSVSDDFSYTAEPLKKPKMFTDRWNCSYINPWQGPGGTEWNPGHSYVTNGHLGIAASRKEGTETVYTGIVTSKESFKYPLFIEARAKISNQVLASNVWMLSKDSTEEIDVLEAYGSDRPDQGWYEKRLHLSHHVFIRSPFQTPEAGIRMGLSGGMIFTVLESTGEIHGTWNTMSMGSWYARFRANRSLILRGLLKAPA